MSMESSKQFLERMMKDEAMYESARAAEPEEIVALAAGLGYEVTPAELEAALKEFRQASDQVPDQLKLEEMDKVAGGGAWSGEDARDGHELGCLMAYHDKEWQYEHNVWCRNMYWCYLYNLGGATP